MKKTLAIVALLAVLVLTLTACGGGGGIVGKGEGTGKMEGMEGVALPITMEFTADGKVTLSMSFMGESQSETSDYEYKDGKLTINGQTTPVTLSGNKLVMEQEGIKLELTRK